MKASLPRLAPQGVPPLTKADFALPPPAQSADVKPQDLFKAVGAALSYWSLVEEHLGQLFAAMLHTRSLAATRALGAIVSASGRIDVVDAAAEVALLPHASLYKSWTCWEKTLREASARRNEIAHGYVSDLTVNHVKIGAVLVPSLHNPRKTEMSGFKHKYRYNAEMVRGIRDKFKLLEVQLFDFTRDVETEIRAAEDERHQTKEA